VDWAGYCRTGEGNAAEKDGGNAKYPCFPPVKTFGKIQSQDFVVKNVLRIFPV